jgi:hypothetical protein
MDRESEERHNRAKISVEREQDLCTTPEHIQDSINADYSMYSTFLTASPGSVLFSRSNLLKRKDLCFSCLRLGLISYRRSLRSSHLFSSGLTRFRCVTTREDDILVKISIGIQIVLSPRTVFCDWLVE